MGTILTRIVSAFLAGATTLSVVAAPQVMKKAGNSNSRAELTSVASAVNPRAEKGITLPKTPRTRKAASQFGLRKYTSTTTSFKGATKVSYGAAAGIPEMYGTVLHANNWGGESQIGLYSVPTQAGGAFDLKIADAEASSGGVLVNDIYWATNYFSFWGYILVTVTGYDFVTGDVVATFNGNVDNIALGLSVDPTTGTVYGVTYNSQGNGLQLATLVYSETGVTVTPIGEFNYNTNSIAFDSTGQLYGILYSGEEVGEDFIVGDSYLVKIDKNTADFDIVGVTGLSPQYLSDAVIDTKTNRMFWTLSEASGAGYLAEVNLTTGVATKLFDFPNDEEVDGLVIPATPEGNAPAAPKKVSPDFNGGSLTGSVYVDLPSTYYDGSDAGWDRMTCHLLVNGEEVSAKSGFAGSTVGFVDVTVPAPGEYSFVAYCSNDNGNGPKISVKKFIGNGLPATPEVTAEYVDGTINVAWAPVTTTVDGGYIDPAAITYTVTRYPDAVVVATGLTTTYYSEPYTASADGAMESYIYGVVADNAGVASAEGKSNPLVFGDIVPPYAPTFSSDDDLAGFTIIDGNADGKTWKVEDNRLKMTYNTSVAMDDWLITPPVKLQAGMAYKLTFKAKANSNSFPERIEVKGGKSNTVAGMTETLVEPTVLSGTETELTAWITPATDGGYYVGFHGISDKDMYNLWLYDIRIEAGVSAAGPGKPTDLTVTPAADGTLSAEISFKTPTVDFSGNPLTSLTKAEVYRGETLVKTFDAPAVGATLTFTDNLPESGDYTYSVCVYNESGKGESVTAAAYVGIDYPAAPTLVNLEESATNPGYVTVSWNAVTTSENGGALAPDQVKYNLYEYDGSSRYLVAGNLTETTYSYMAVPSGQDFMQYLVYAVTVRGEGEGQISDMIPVGQPYTNYSEDFAGGSISTLLGYGPMPGATSMCTLGLAKDGDLGITSVNADGGFIYSKGANIGQGVRIFTGKISLANIENPAFTFYVYNIVGEEGAADINTVSVGVRPTGAFSYTDVLPTTAINDLSTEADGWNKVTVDLSAYKGQTVQICLDAAIELFSYNIFDNFAVISLLDYNLKAADITAPAKVKPGTSYDVNVTVSNEGGLEATGYSVELYADNEKVATKEGAALAAGKNTVITFTEEMSALATEPVTYKAIVVFASDMDLANNETAEIVVTPNVSTLPAVTDLAADATAEGVKLTWSEPDLSAATPEAITEDFENAEAWAHEYGDWTFLDVDNSPVGGFEGMDVPGIVVGQTKSSFFVWDQATSGGNSTFDAKSGKKYLAALFRYDNGTCNDWAISPELFGGAQTISFFASSYSSEYPESIEVLYSTGSLNPADFVSLLNVNVVPSTWTEYTVDLPEGAKHFAIRGKGTASFMLMVDDVTFIPASSTADLSIVGYDIYRNGEKITAEPVAELEYVDTTVADGENTYVVVVVYDKGVSAPSNEVTINFTTGLDALTAGVSVTTAPRTIIVTGAEEVMVEVYAVDGKQIYAAQGDATISVVPGVYVVTVDGKVVKLIVK